MRIPAWRPNVIYADPPWAYANKKTGGSHTSGAEQQYDTLSLDELCLLPILDTFASTSVLFLWGTTPLGVDPYDLMAGWGYTYKTELYWHKLGRRGTGYWFIGEVEKLLFGVRGRVPAFRSGIPNHVAARVGKHSEKPAEFRAIIERATAPITALRPLRRLELFARVQSPGWRARGYELDGRDLREG